MSFIAKPIAHHPALPQNAQGLTRRDYEGTMSTLCAGCGHDSITAALIEACFEIDLAAAPHRQGVGHRLLVQGADLFPLSRARLQQRARAHAFGHRPARRWPTATSLHRRIRRRRHRLHRAWPVLPRRAPRLNMTYIVMNNGCYGLTKGQFSATNDKTSPPRRARPTRSRPSTSSRWRSSSAPVSSPARSPATRPSWCRSSRRPSATTASRSRRDLPCVTFNNHPASTKSYDYVRAHNMASEKQLDYVEPKEEITVDFAEGTTADIELHDGSRLLLSKLGAQHDPRDADAALMTIRANAARGTVTTGLLYIDQSQRDMHNVLATDARPLNALPMAELCPGSKALEAINARLA